MQRMYNLDKWTEIADENGLHFSNPRPRRVSIEVNSPAKAVLSLIDHTGEVHFLALVEGRDTLEFNSLGAFSIISDMASTMIYTADGADISAEIIAPVIFTRVANRRRRNPELEALAHAMQYNLEKRLNEQAARFEQQIHRRFEATARLAESKAGPPSLADDAQPTPKGADQRPLQSAGGSGRGTGGGHEAGQDRSESDGTPDSEILQRGASPAGKQAVPRNPKVQGTAVEGGQE